jgi:hypothetical protein
VLLGVAVVVVVCLVCLDDDGGVMMMMTVMTESVDVQDDLAQALGKNRQDDKVVLVEE